MKEERVHEIACEITDDWVDDGADPTKVLHYIAKGIQKAIAEENAWVPVTERLPEPFVLFPELPMPNGQILPPQAASKKVLVYQPNNPVFITKLIYPQEGKPQWYQEDGLITHWKPLPSTPEDGHE